MISEFDEVELSFLEQSKDLETFKNLIDTLSSEELELELEMLSWTIAGCIPDHEPALNSLREIVIKAIDKVGGLK